MGSKHDADISVLELHIYNLLDKFGFLIVSTQIYQLTYSIG